MNDVKSERDRLILEEHRELQLSQAVKRQLRYPTELPPTNDVDSDNCNQQQGAEAVSQVVNNKRSYESMGKVTCHFFYLPVPS